MSSTMGFTFNWHPNESYLNVAPPKTPAPIGSLNKLHYCHY